MHERLTGAEQNLAEQVLDQVHHPLRHKKLSKNPIDDLPAESFHALTIALSWTITRLLAFAAMPVAHGPWTCAARARIPVESQRCRSDGQVHKSTMIGHRKKQEAWSPLCVSEGKYGTRIRAHQREGKGRSDGDNMDGQVSGEGGHETGWRTKQLIDLRSVLM